jgi:cardiolipin synthase
LGSFSGRFLAATAALLVAGCAVPQIDRFMLQAERAPVRLAGANGRLSAARSKEILAALQSKTADVGLLERHVALEEAIAGNPLTVGNAVRLLEDGPETYAAMLAAIRSARHHVHMESYIFEADEVGEQFAQALIERHKAGIEVRLVVDAVGSIGTPPEFLQGLRDAGVQVEVYNPITAGTVLARGFDLQKRDHRKLTIVDGTIAFLGGINISGKYTIEGMGGQRGGIAGSGAGGTSGGPSGAGGTGGSSGSFRRMRDLPFEDRPWRDTQVRLEGPVVSDLQRSFLRIWGEIAKEPAREAKAYLPAVPARGNHLVRAVEGSPGQGANAMYVALIAAIDNAEKSVRITMAYFVPHDALLASLQAAARRGVEVQIVLPSRTDNWLVLYAGRAYYEDLLEAGVKIHERQNRLLHAKTATVDGVWSTVGSTNLDWRSLAYNEELNAVVLGPDFAAELEGDFAQDIKRSQAITRESWAHRPLSDRIRETAARAWALLL